MDTIKAIDACITETPSGRTYWEFHDGRWLRNDHATWNLNRAYERRDPRLMEMIDRSKSSMRKPFLDLTALTDDEFEQWMRGEYPGDWGGCTVSGLPEDKLRRALFKNCG